MECEHLDRGPNDPEHPPVRAGSGQIALLDAAQRLGRSGVAGDDHQRTASLEERLHALERESKHDFERAIAVGRARIVTEVDVVVIRQLGPDALEDGQATESAVEDADRTWHRRKQWGRSARAHAWADLAGTGPCGQLVAWRDGAGHGCGALHWTTSSTMMWPQSAVESSTISRRASLPRNGARFHSRRPSTSAS